MSYHLCRTIHSRISGRYQRHRAREINQCAVLGTSRNGSSHIIFKLDTKAVVSVNRVVIITTSKTVIDRNNELGISEKQPESVQFTDKDIRVRISDLDLNLNDDDRNASDESFDHDEEYHKEFDKESKDKDLATGKVHDTHFQLPFQQHHALVTDKPSKVRSEGNAVKRGQINTNVRRSRKTIALEMTMIVLMLTTMMTTVPR